MRTLILLCTLALAAHAEEATDLMWPWPKGARAAESSPLTLKEIHDGAKAFWSPRMAEAAKNLKGDDELVAALAEQAEQHELLSLLMLKRVVAIESKADRSQGKNRFGYAGLFQLGRPACKDLGIEFETVDEPKEWKANVAAGVRYLVLTHRRMTQTLANSYKHSEVELGAFHLYLAHQQGAAGCARLVAQILSGAASETPANRNMRANMHRALTKAATADGHQLREAEYYAYVLGAFAAASEHVKK